MSYPSDLGRVHVSYQVGRPIRRTLSPVSHPSQTFTVAQAADVCQVSRKTITRRYEQLKLGGAYKDKAGQWAIPVAALLLVGLRPGRPAAPDTVPSTPASALGQQDTATALRVAELEAQVTEYRHRAEVAEQLAAERSARVEDLRQALRMLEVGRPMPMPDPMPLPDPLPIPAPAPVPAPGGWWQRWRRAAH